MKKIVSLTKSSTIIIGIVCAFTSYAPFVNAQTITTIAGGNGDGLAATTVGFTYPNGVAVDTSGNVYVAFFDDNCVRMINTSGIITTFAGNSSTQGYSGDGGPATAAHLAGPRALAIDGSGNVFIADYWNNCIRKVDASGIITTVVGGDTCGYCGDGGPATFAGLSQPSGVMLDGSGNIFIASDGYSRIRKVNTSGIISTIAGNGTGGFSGDGGAATAAVLYSPHGLCIDSIGNLFIADFSNNRIRKINTSGIISTVAGNGTAGYSGDGGVATAANLNGPTRLAIDAGGNLIISDYNNNRIRMVNTLGVITTIAGNGTSGFSGDGAAATAAMLNGPSGLAINGTGNLIFADISNNRVRKVNIAGIISTIAGKGVIGGYSGDGVAATTAELFGPTSVAADSNGNKFIADFLNNRIRMISVSGIISTYAGNGTAGYSGDNGAATSAKLNGPRAVVADKNGNIYIADYYNNRVRMVNASGIITTIAGCGIAGNSGDGGLATIAKLSEPRGIAVDGSGNLLIADAGNSCIRKVNTTGVITTVAGTNGVGGFFGDGYPATLAYLQYPTGVAVDNNGNMFIADSGNSCVYRVDVSDNIFTFAGQFLSPFYGGDGGLAEYAYLNSPQGISLDSSGNIFIADQGNNVIRVINTSGIISTFAGYTVSGFSGDGGPATTAQFNMPGGVCVDGNGSLLISDNNNNRIRKVIYTTGVPNVSDEAGKITLYPNPTTHIINIQSKQPVDAEIMSMVGKLIGTKKNATRIDLAGLRAGVYLIRFTDSATGLMLQTSRVVKMDD